MLTSVQEVMAIALGLRGGARDLTRVADSFLRLRENLMLPVGQPRSRGPVPPVTNFARPLNMLTIVQKESSKKWT